MKSVPTELRWWVPVLLGMLVITFQVRAAEVDQFTLPPGEPVALADSALVLNAEVNRLLQQAIAQANSRVMRVDHKNGSRWVQPRCDEPRLYQALASQLARSVVGQLETFAEQSDQVSRRRVAFENSIYRTFEWQSSPTLVLTERMAAVINLNGVDMGTDKLGHFFTEGYSYFLVTDQLNKSIDSALLFGEWSESAYYGAQTTGVFSFADLVANFQGLRFWNRVLARQPDPLTPANSAQYVQCKSERWVQAQTFRWSDYVDKGWSEVANCPALRSDDLLQRMRQQPVHCKADQLPVGKYGVWQRRLLNSAGYRVLPDYLQPELILKARADRQDVDVSDETLEYLGELRMRLEAWRVASAAAANNSAP